MVRRSGKTTLLLWSLLLGLGSFLIESLYLYFKQGPFFGALGAWGVPVVAAYLGIGLVLALALRQRVSAWSAFAIVAVVFYGIESTKMFVISAPLLGSPSTVGGFALASFMVFAGLVAVAKRLSLDPSILIWFVWVYCATCYATAFQWQSAGGSLTAFLTSSPVLTIAAAGAAAFLVVIWITRQPHRSLVTSVILFAFVAVIIGTMSNTGSNIQAAQKGTDAKRPDIYVASFDALGRDVLRRYCDASAGAAARICERGLHFPNTIADGLATYEILRANTFGGRSYSRCEDSLPGMAAAQAYETSMWLGRKGVRIRGADCYGYYFSGRGVDIATRFALPAVAEHLSGALRSGGADSREEFVDSSVMLSELRAHQSAEYPHFAYLHFLDLHAPYRPSSVAEPEEHADKIRRFMGSCYRVGCDLSANDSLIAYAKESFERSLPEVDRHLAQLFEIAESRGRPYLVVLTADHGELFGEHDGFGHTGGFVPELLSVPFVVYDSRHDYRAANDCSLALTSSALRSFFQRELGNAGVVEPGGALDTASSVEIHDSLGVATLDASSEEIRFRISEPMLKQSGTSRNVHLKQKGTLPYPLEDCGETEDADLAR